MDDWPNVRNLTVDRRKSGWIWKWPKRYKVYIHCMQIAAHQNLLFFWPFSPVLHGSFDKVGGGLFFHPPLDTLLRSLSDSLWQWQSGTQEAFKKWEAPVFRGTLINKDRQLFKQQRGTWPNNLRKVGGTCPCTPRPVDSWTGMGGHGWPV